jgi:glycosyltransferase involved in cell wall biosynthesis
MRTSLRGKVTAALRRKVLVITSHHPSRRQPARALYGYYTYRALARYCEIRFLAPIAWWSRLRTPSELLRAPRERWDEIEIAYPSYWSVPGAPPLHALGMAASLARPVAALRRAFGFEAILSAWAYPDAVAAAAIATREKVPLITTVLGSDINLLPHDRALGFQIKYGLGHAQRIVAVSEALGEAVAQLGLPREKIVVQHNAVDGDRFVIRDRRAARAELGVPSDRPLIGYVGNLRPEKGGDVLLEAMALLVARDARPVDLAMIGGGPYEAELHQLAAARQLGERVRFLGVKVHDEVPRWLSAFDVLCLPSRREGCPNVVLEALASGRPVVASAVGGVPELLRRDNGILVPSERPDELADALARALDRSWDAEALRASVPSPSWDTVARTYERLIDEVISEW